MIKDQDAHDRQAAMYDPEACLFFARAPQDVTPEDLTALFSPYGAVEDVSIYRSWPAAKTSKGCGTVQFADKASAIAALAALNGSSNLPRAEGALVVERMDPRQQKNKACATKKLSRSKSGARDTQPDADQASTAKHKPGSTPAAAAAAGSAAAGPALYSNEENSNAWGSHAIMASPASVDEEIMLAMLSSEIQMLGVPRGGAATSHNDTSTSNANVRSGSTGYTFAPGTMARGPAWWAIAPSCSAYLGAWQCAWQQQQQRPGRSPRASPRSRRSSAPISGRPAAGGFHTPSTSWCATPQAAAGAAAGVQHAWSLNAVAVAGDAGAAELDWRPASLQGSYSSWGSLTSPPLMQQQPQQQTPHAGVGALCFQTPPVAVAGAMQTAFHGFEPALASYTSSSLTSSYSVSSAPAHSSFALFGSPGMSQTILAGAFDGSAAAATAAATATGPMFPASTGSQLCHTSTATSSFDGSQGFADQGGPEDVSLMDWLMLQQQLQQLEAEGMAAAAGSPAEPAWVSGLGVAVLFPEQVPALLHSEAPPTLGSPVAGLAMTPAVAIPAPPPPPPPAAAGAASDISLASALLLGMQQQQMLANAQQQMPLADTTAQQQLMTVELELQAWASIAENGGWQYVARLSGAQIEVQVQASSRLLALQVSGTAAQVHMVSELMCLLLQQPTMAARGVALHA